MKYFAKDLQSVYEILGMLPKPLAVLDFMCGTVGCEFAAAQSVGGQFYDKWNRDARVIALCWEGASILYSNISDDQIEFMDKKRSRLGDKQAEGWKKFRWLKEQGHAERIAAIVGIVARSGPYDVSGKAMKKYYNLDTGKQWLMAKERLVRTGHVFSTGNSPLVREPYIAIFDRNEHIDKRRNTRMSRVRLFHQWAKDFGFKLVVISDFYPRRWEGMVRVSFADRNLDRLCNIIRHSVLYAAPSSGSSCAGWVFGCNFVGLRRDLQSPFWPMLTRDIVPSIIGGRGFRYFGTLADSPEPNGKVANRVKEYLREEGYA